MSFARHPLSRWVAFALGLLAIVVASGARADDWTFTGSGIRQKKIAFVSVDVYAISHFMKQLPPAKSKQAVIDMDTGKKFVWTMKRDVDRDKIRSALTDAFAMNGYGDGGKIGQFLGAFQADLKEGGVVSIVYDADRKVTTVSTGSGSATVAGVDFMRGVWSLWFGKIDQPSLGDALISRIP